MAQLLELLLFRVSFPSSHFAIGYSRMFNLFIPSKRCRRGGLRSILWGTLALAVASGSVEAISAAPTQAPPEATGKASMAPVAGQAGVGDRVAVESAAQEVDHRHSPGLNVSLDDGSPAHGDGDGKGIERLRCLNGSYTRGSWGEVRDAESRKDGLRSIYATAGGAGQDEEAFQQASPGEVRPPASYEWVPEDCELLPFSPEGVCDALAGRSILFVGDSTTFEMFLSFVAQMYKEDSRKEFSQHDPGLCGPVEVCPADEETGRKAATVAYIRNDHLTIDNPPLEDEPTPKDQAKRDCSPYGDLCYPWMPYLVEFEIAVLNSGAHTVRSVKGYEEITRRAVTALGKIGYEGGVFYRTSTPGHTNCGNATGPVSLEDESALEPFEDYHNPNYRHYKWDQMVQGNEIAKRVWSQGGATILDGAPLFRLRPDGHRSERDCLHYGLPGPPDLWARLLYNALSGRIV